MSAASMLATDTGLEVVDISDDIAFRARHLHDHDTVEQMEALRRLAQIVVERPENTLQELVNAAVKLCGADSAGVSIERHDAPDSEFYHWVATAGAYDGFLGATLPRYPSACGVCLERGRPQTFRVKQRFFDILGVKAPLVTDGILLPWHVEDTRGTIFIMAHGRDLAFDESDCRLMGLLAEFAAMGFRQQKQQQLLLERTSAEAAAAMANKLAHRINNPLQCLTNTLFLAANGYHGEEAKKVGQEALHDLERLSDLVKKLLSLPFGEHD